MLEEEPLRNAVSKNVANFVGQSAETRQKISTSMALCVLGSQLIDMKRRYPSSIFQLIGGYVCWSRAYDRGSSRPCCCDTERKRSGFKVAMMLAVSGYILEFWFVPLCYIVRVMRERPFRDFEIVASLHTTNPQTNVIDT